MTASDKNAKVGLRISARLRRLNASNEFAAIAYRLFQAAAMLLCFRLITIHFGVVSYGIVGLLLSWVVYLTFLDFGIISLMRSEIPYAYQLQGQRHANGVARAGLLRLVRFTLVIYVAFVVMLLASDWPLRPLMDFIKLAGKLSVSQFRILLLLIACYAVCILLTNFLQAFMSARGRQYQVFHFLILGTLVQIGAVLAGIMANISLSAVFGLLILSGFIPLLSLGLRELRGILGNYDPSATLEVHSTKISSAFFIIQLTGTLSNNMDTLLVAHFYSFREVAIYATMKLIIQLLISLQGNYMNQAWPLFSARRAARDWDAVNDVLRDRMIKTVLFSAISALGLIVFCPLLFPIWSKHLLTIGVGLSAAFGMQIIVYMISACLSVMIFSFNYVKPLAWLAPLSPVIILTTVYALFRMGLVSVVLANTASQFLGLGVGLYFYFVAFPKMRAAAQG